jgi:hypothetical protein
MDSPGYLLKMKRVPRPLIGHNLRYLAADYISPSRDFGNFADRIENASSTAEQRSRDARAMSAH